MKAVNISEAAKRLKVHRQVVYRLIAAGAIQRLPGSGLIPLDSLQGIPRQRASLKNGCIRKIKLAGHEDPRRILYRLCSAARYGADADTLLHAGRLMLAGDREFLDTLESPAAPVVQCPDLPARSRPPRLGFPSFIAGRVRLFSRPLPKNIPFLSMLWPEFWSAVTRSKLETFPMFSGGWLRMAPKWQHDAAFFCRLDNPVLSFGSPSYRPTKHETDAVEYMGKRFRDALSGDQFGRDGVPAVLSIIQAWNLAEKELPDNAKDKLKAIGIPPGIADTLVLLVCQFYEQSRMIQIDTKGREPKPSPREIYEATWAAADRMDGVESYAAEFSSQQRPTRASIIQALGISMVTLRRWTTSG